MIILKQADILLRFVRTIGECVFGEFADGEMRLSEVDKIVCDNWLEIPKHFPNVELDAFVVMPNHIHGIIEWFDDHSKGRDLINQILQVNPERMLPNGY